MGTRPDVPTTAVLAPHPDDGVLSAWHVLARHPGSTLLVTVFSGLPEPGTVAAPHDRATGAREPRARMAERRAEDRAVADRFGWEVRTVDLVEQSYRDPLVTLSDTFAALLVDTIAAVVPETVRRLVLPAGLGGHIDHHLVRAAGITLAARTGRSVDLVADVPYATREGWPTWVTVGVGRDGGTGDEPDDGAVDGPDDGPDDGAVDPRWAEWLDPLRPGLGRPVVHLLAPDEQAAKLEAARSYATQFDFLEGGSERNLSRPDRLAAEVSWPVDAALLARGRAPRAAGAAD